MKKNYISLSLLALISFSIISCSQVNREAREEYRKEHSFRHGVVPISTPREMKKVELVASDSKSNARGKVLYQVHCMSCHGRFGHGDGVEAKRLPKKPRDISNLATEVPNFKFFMMISKWKGSMPGWKTFLTEKEISDLEAYLVDFGRNSDG